MGHRVLLVRFSSLGDVILATPVVRAIRTQYPDAHVTFVTKTIWSPLVERAPGVDRVIGLAPGESVRALARRLPGPFDHRVDLHAGLRSAALRFLLGGRWGVYRSHPVRRRWMARRHRASPALRPVPERFLHAARDAGLDDLPAAGPATIAPTAEDRARAARLAAAPYVVLCPGAAHANKRWPPRHWWELAAALSGGGVTTVATGLDRERSLLAGPNIIDAFGLPLGPTAALLAGARAVVANDSGLMHLATAVGTPVLALFGPTTPAFGYGPYQAVARVLERDLPCRPCSPHGGPRCPLRHHACLGHLRPELVADAMKPLVA